MTDTTQARPAGPKHPAAWALALLALLLIAGTGIGLYLTRFHENALHGDSSVELANCPRDETTNCEVVNTSAWSEIAGVPISALAIPTYLLLLGMVVAARRRPALLGYVLAIGLGAVIYSGYLYYVSTVKIGFLCLWCFRLYLVNAGIPLLAALAARRNPVLLLREALAGLRRFAPPVLASSASFALLLVATIAADRGYRASLTRVTAAQPPAGAAAADASAPLPAPTPVPLPIAEPPGAIPAPAENRVPPTSAKSSSRPRAAEARPAGQPETAPIVPPVANAAIPPPPSGPAAPGAYVLTSPLKLITGHPGGIDVKPFDLQGRIGRGRPMALIFWAPGFAVSEQALGALSRHLAKETPAYQVFAVAGKRDDQRPEMLWERFLMLDRAPGLPLLMDEGFALSKQIDVTDVPNLVLLDARGRLEVTKIKGLEQVVSLSPLRQTAGEIIQRVAHGSLPEPIERVPPYYPASELFGRCAPAFTLPDVMTHREVTFNGRSPNGRPTLLVFWSSTCKHCQVEIPKLVEYTRAHPEVLNVVTVSFIKPDRPDGFSHRKVTEAYIRTNGITWPVLDDSSGFADDLYRVVSTPTSFLITPDGTVVDAWFFTHENLAQAIEEVRPRLAARGGACRPAAPEAPARAAFSVVSPEGTTVPLKSLTDRPSLVHLWATWCVPCQTELPGLLKFRRSLEDAGGRLVLVSVEDEAAGDRIRAYGTRLDGGFQSFRAPKGGLADLLDLSYSVPRTFLLGSDGQVLKIYFGAQPWEDPAFQAKVRALMQLSSRRG